MGLSIIIFLNVLKEPLYPLNNRDAKNLHILSYSNHFEVCFLDSIIVRICTFGKCFSRLLFMTGNDRRDFVFTFTFD